MTDRVLQWIKRDRMIQKGDWVIAGVSGGADSVCLLLVLEELMDKLGFSLSAVHVEHGIRGQESREDAEFVTKLCRDMGIFCQVYSLDVPRSAIEMKLGYEETARLMRYDCYRKEAQRVQKENGEKQPSGIRIALAHHADDNAETMLFQMIRGSSIDGLGGMRMRRALDSGTEIIRPLLGVTRAEIEAFLEKRGQVFRVDSTNSDTDYSRNRLRHVVFPQLQLINSRAVQHMNRSAIELQEIAAYIAGQTEEVVRQTTDMQFGEVVKQSSDMQSGEGVCIREQILSYPLFLQREAVHRVLAETAGSSKDIGRVHIEAVLSLFTLQVGRRICLPYRMTAVRTYDGICLEQDGVSSVRGKKQSICKEEKNVWKKERSVCGTKQNTDRMEPDCYEITTEQLRLAEKGETVIIDLPDGKIQMKIFDFSGNMDKISKNKYTKWLNYDKIKSSLHIRRRQSQDYLTIDAQGHKKKLKAYFVDEKIPQKERDNIWLLAEQSHILWVIGGRISAHYRMEPGTGKILEVQKIGGKEL